MFYAPSLMDGIVFGSTRQYKIGTSYLLNTKNLLLAHINYAVDPPGIFTKEEEGKNYETLEGHIYQVKQEWVDAVIEDFGMDSNIKFNPKKDA